MTLIEVSRENPLYEQNLQLNVVSPDNEYVRPITLRILTGIPYYLLFVVVELLNPSYPHRCSKSHGEDITYGANR